MILILAVAMYLYQQQKRKILSLRPSDESNLKRLLPRANGWNKYNALFSGNQILIISAHVGSQLVFFLSVLGNFLLILSVVSNIFRPLSLVG